MQFTIHVFSKILDTYIEYDIQYGTIILRWSREVVFKIFSMSISRAWNTVVDELHNSWTIKLYLPLVFSYYYGHCHGQIGVCSRSAL